MTHPGDLLSAYLDGELGPGERSEVDTHLAACASCRAELDGTATARTALRSLPVLEPPAHLLPEPAEPAARRGLRWRLAWATAAVVAVLAGIGLVTGGDAGPVFDLDTLSERHTARLVVDPGISTLRGSVGGP